MENDSTINFSLRFWTLELVFYFLSPFHFHKVFFVNILFGARSMRAWASLPPRSYCWVYLSFPWLTVKFTGDSWPTSLNGHVANWGSFSVACFPNRAGSAWVAGFERWPRSLINDGGQRLFTFYLSSHRKGGLSEISFHLDKFSAIRLQHQQHQFTIYILSFPHTRGHYWFFENFWSLWWIATSFPLFHDSLSIESFFDWLNRPIEGCGKVYLLSIATSNLRMENEEVGSQF